VLPVPDRAFIIKRLGVMTSHLNLTWGLHSCQERAEECSYCFMVPHSTEGVEIALVVLLQHPIELLKRTSHFIKTLSSTNKSKQMF
jgi:hypothetical protein